MHARTNFAAAAGLAIATGVAVVGTIWQTESASVGCSHAPRQNEATRASLSSEPWEDSLSRALHRVEDGFLRMAGVTRMP